ncbi:MAG: ribonuclease HI family protein [Planctomycetaceae bacterium]|nr:ribonuclease HI family protein [Planctomycetaceae bacterium]
MAPDASPAATPPLHPDVIACIDGGARGNPGPAAAGVVIKDAATGKAIYKAGIFIGHATNNIAEYQGLLNAFKTAAKLGAQKVLVLSDSELMVRQMTGRYRVKNAGLRPLFEQAGALAEQFKHVEYRHVRREQNTEADDLVNRALDFKKNVGDVL